MPGRVGPPCSLHWKASSEREGLQRLRCMEWGTGLEYGTPTKRAVRSNGSRQNQQTAAFLPSAASPAPLGGSLGMA